MLSYFLSLGCQSFCCARAHWELRRDRLSLYVVLLSFPLLWASQKTRISFDQVYRSCRRQLRVRTLAVPVLPWYQEKATSPSSLVRHQREGTLLPRAVLAGRMFFSTCGTQNHYPRYPRIIQCADKLVMLLLHLSNAFVWHFIFFPAPLGSSLWARQYYSQCTDEALETLEKFVVDSFSSLFSSLSLS